MIEGGGAVVQETLHFDPHSGSITSLRSKEEAHDYRYFPDPDLLPITISPEMLDSAQAAWSSCPRARRASRRRHGLERARPRGCWHSARARRLLRAGLGARGRVFPRGARELAQRPAGAADDETTRRTRMSRRASWRRLSRWSTRGDHTGRRTPGARRARRGAAGTRGRIVEREGLAAMDSGDELAQIVAAAIAANPDAASACAPATQRRSGRSSARSCARAAAAPTAARSRG